jgi:hypothetical protein
VERDAAVPLSAGPAAAAMHEFEAEAQCPHCWQAITLLLDLSVESQEYVEDCSVCCHPLTIRYAAVDGELEWLDVAALEQ